MRRAVIALLLLLPLLAEARPLWRVIVAGHALALPLPAGWCRLDEADPVDARLLDWLGPSPQREILATAIPCDGERRPEAALAGELPVLRWMVEVPADGGPTPLVVPETARVLDHVAALFPEGPGIEAERPLPRGRLFSRSRQDGRDEFGVHVWSVFDIRQEDAPPLRLCERLSFGVARQVLLHLSVQLYCPAGEAALDLGRALQPGLLARLAEVNPAP
jgi:hypothetical protein